MPVRELLARTSSLELSEWMAYERLTGPLDTRHRGDIQAAIMASTVANSQRSKGRAFKPDEFIPQWDKRKMTPDEMWRAAMAANSSLGGTTG